MDDLDLGRLAAVAGEGGGDDDMLDLLAADGASRSVLLKLNSCTAFTVPSCGVRQGRR
jgi:hypothetical protein